MFQRIRGLFALPHFEDEDQNLAARLLSAILVTVVGLTFFLTFPLALMLPARQLSNCISGSYCAGPVRIPILSNAARAGGNCFLVIDKFVLAVKYTLSLDWGRYALLGLFEFHADYSYRRTFAWRKGRSYFYNLICAVRFIDGDR